MLKDAEEVETHPFDSEKVNDVTRLRISEAASVSEHSLLLTLVPNT